MARVFDVIEWADEMPNEIVHRFPETGPGDFRIGSQVIVREAQAAVFFRDGKALDVLGPGRHTITTANIPLLINFLGKAFDDRSPFTAEVYFVSMREFRDRKWGTPQPIPVQTPGVGLGWLLLKGFGTYSYQVKNPQQFVTQIVGTRGIYLMSDIENDLRSRLLRSLTDMFGEMKGKYQTVQDILGWLDEISAGVRAKAAAEFEAIGLELKTFVIASMTPSENTAEELRSRGLLDAQMYAQLQAADAMREAAQNPSGGAGLTAGIGAGMGIGNMISQTMNGMTQQAQQPQQSAQQGAGNALPPVMTPAEAAQVLRVSEEDVIAAIESGDLPARKIGRAYRISREALEKFLGG
ncbi:MAG TPA: helix-turn-helix domain-containing protein [Chloroflexi bacterium]|nr:helix-turn-helix domain-containing protein [Chloroflexota bacterium]